MELRTIADLEKVQDVTPFHRNLLGVVEDLKEFLRWKNANQDWKFQFGIEIGGHRASNVFHPSSAGKACDLAVQLERTGAEQTAEDWDSVITFDTGHLWHKWVQACLTEMYGQDFQYEVRIRNDSPPVAGSADGVITLSDLRAVIEIKTAKDGDGPKNFAAARNGPFDEHVRQVTPYMSRLDVPLALFLYFNKNEPGIIAHVITYDERVWQAIVDRWNKIDALIAKGQEAEHKSSFLCKWCSYRGVCKYSGDKSNATKVRRI